VAKEPTKTEDRKDHDQEVFMREVDEAVRKDEARNFARKHGLPIGGVLVLGLAAFGGFLLWKSQNEKTLELGSEQYISALDELQAGNLDVAEEKLALIEAGDSASAAAIATMTRAGIAFEAGRIADAAGMYAQVADNAELPQEFRDLARLREVTAIYDTLKPQEVIDRVGPLANEGSTYYGNAAELVAHAYLAQGKQREAGALLVTIARNEANPETLRARARQLAGVLGFDAIEDVEETLANIGAGEAAGDSGAPVN